MRLEPFHPGASPCSDACTLDWASQAAGVSPAPVLPMTLPAGTPITWMSWGQGGQPYGGSVAQVSMQDHVGQGFDLPGGAAFFRFTECGNWAVVHPIGGALSVPDPAITREHSAASLFAGDAGILSSQRVAVTVSTSSQVSSGGFESAPAPIPLPASAFALAAALLALGAFRLIHRSTDKRSG